MNGESWAMDPATRDYVQVNGRPVIDTTLQSPAYFRLAVGRTRWLHAPDSSYGSDFWTQRAKNSPDRATTLSGIGEQALKPIVDDGRATDATVSVDSRGRHWCQLDASITDADGNVVQVNLNPIGV